MKTTTIFKQSALLLLMAIVANLTAFGQNSITNPDTVCMGITEIYRVDSVDNSYYHWMVKGGSGTINQLYPPNDSAAHISVTWVNSLGFDTLMVVEYNEFGCNGDTNKLRVERYSQPAPTLSIGAVTQCVGTTFSVTASPNAVAAGLTFQWFKEGIAITDSTRASLVLPNIQLSDAGSYTCSVANICGEVLTPVAAVLTVIYPPVVTLQPFAISTCLGLNDTLIAHFDGSAPLTYQWFLGTTPVNNAAGHISGATDDTLVITGMTYADTGYYHIVATNICDFISTDTVLVNINVVPEVTNQPDSVSVCIGNNVTFEATLTGDSLFYQWYHYSNPVAGATTPELNLVNVQYADTGSYHLYTYNTCGLIRTDTVDLNINRYPTIVNQPDSVSVCLTANVMFTVVATGDSLSYQWYHYTTPVGTNANTLVIPNAQYADTGAYYCTISVPNGCNSINTDPADLNINRYPTIVNQPDSVSVCIGANVTFAVAATGDSLSYQWYHYATPVGTNSNMLVIPNTQYADTGTYRCDISVPNGCNTLPSVNADLNINRYPAIVNQPDSVSVCLGDNVTFAVAATGDSLSYQWYHYTTPVGTNANTLVIPNAQYADTGTYHCAISVPNGCNSINTIDADLNINRYPTIVDQPDSVSVCLGAEVTFAVTATGDSLSYQWYHYTTPVGTNSNLLVINNAQYADTGTYRCDISVPNGCNTLASINADLNINRYPVIVNQPDSVSVCLAADVTFTVVATGDSLSYQWYHYTTPVGTNASTLFIPNAQYADTGTYYCTISVPNGCNSINTLNADLNINRYPIIVDQPDSISTCPGFPMQQFTMAATGDSLYYQWYKNGVLMPGQTLPVLTFAPVAYSDTADYYCKVFNNCSFEDSQNTNLNINIPPVIVNEPTDISTCLGANITLNTTITGDSLFYQWRRNGNPIAGATAPSLNINPVTLTNIGSITCNVINTCGNVTTSPAVVTVNLVPVVIEEPNNISTCPGQSVVFSTVVTGDSLNYQWYKNGVQLPGRTLPALVFSPVTYADTADYYCVITNTCGDDTTRVVNLNINIPPVITVAPHDVSSCLGDNEILSVTATGDSLFYQWYHNTILIPGATNSTYALTPVTLANVGTYDVEVYNTCGNPPVNPIDVTVNLVPVITNQPDSVSVCPGAPVTFTVAATGDSLFYQWRKNNVLMPGQNGPSLVFPAAGYADTANYKCYIWNTCNNALSQNANLNINVAPVITTQPQNLLTCVGDNNQLSVVATGDSLYYQWFKNNVAISGQTGTTLSFIPVALSDIGTYRVDIQNNCAPAISNTINLFANIDPTVIVPPRNVSSCLGYTATFTVGIQALGSALPDFQWYKNGTLMPGKTSNVLTIFPVTLADVASYSCELSNNCDVVMTTSANLTVNLVPVMVTQPNSISTCPGVVEEMKVILTGDSLNYQWYRNGNPIANSNSPFLLFNPIVPTDMATYKVHIWNTCNTAGFDSQTANITLNIPPTIVSDQVTGGNFCTGENKVLSVIATGDSIKYEWRKSGNILADSLDPFLRFNPIALTDNGTYQVRAYNNCGQDISQMANIYVNTTPLITYQTGSISTCDGQNVMLQVNATGDNIGYQWQLEGIDIPGANSNILVLNNLQYSQTGNYVCQLTNSCPPIRYTVPAAVTINRVPDITVQPLTQIRCETELITLNVTATGDSLNYQWYKNGVPITGANSPVYEITSALAANSGLYECFVWNTCGDEMSDPAILTVYRLPGVVTHPVSKTRCEEDTVSFSITPAGDQLSYQWYHNNVAIPGATATTFSIARISMSDAGNYHCVVTSQHCGEANSTPATLNVIQNIAVSAVTNNISCAGSLDGAIDISVLNGQAPFTFNWSTGATTEDITGLDEGLYTVYITDQNNCRARATIGIGEPNLFGFYHDTTFWASASQIGGPGADKISGIVVDKLGNRYVTGSFSSNATFGFANLVSFGDEDMFVARYDAAGTLLWVRQAGGTLNDYGTGISVDSSGYIYVTGSFEEMAFFGTTQVNSAGNHDAFLAKYDPTGALVWVRNTGGFFDDKATAVQADERGYSYITGSYQGISTFGSQTLVSAGGDDIFTAKYNPDGDMQWVRSAGGVSEDFGQAITLDVSRNVIVAGKFQNTAAFGTASLTSAGSTDIFMVKYNTLGTQLWTKRAGGNQTDDATSVKTDDNSNVYVAGSIEGTAAFGALSLTSNGDGDLAVAKYSPAGNPLWARSEGGTQRDAGKALLVDPLGNAYVAGFFRDQMVIGDKTMQSAGVGDILVVKYSTTGELVWSQQAGGTGADSALAIAMVPGKDLLVGGSFNQTALFGANSLTSAGQDEAFLALLTQEEVYTAPVVTDVSCFDGNDGSINITPGGGTLPFTFDWSNAATTEDITNIEEATYWLTMTDAKGCTKDTMLTVTYQFAPPVAPTSANANMDYICTDETGNLVLTAVGGSGDTLVWFSGSCNGTRVGIDNNLTIAPPTVTTTYYAFWKNACGESTCAEVTVHVIPDSEKPTLVTASPALICEGPGLVTLNAYGGSGEILKWYEDGCGVTEIKTGVQVTDLPIPPVSTWYYARWESACGNSECDSVQVIVNPRPVAPTEVTASETSICAGYGLPITLTAVGGSGDEIRWGIGACDAPVYEPGVNPVLINPPTVTTTYYAYWNDNTCGNSPCASVTITVTGTPPAPVSITASENSFCENTVPTLVLTANGGNGDTLKWYTGSCGLTFVGTGNPLTLTGSDVPDVTTTYYARWESTCGNSPCVFKTITVYSVPVVFIQNLNSTYCVNDPAALISGSVSGQGIFSGNGISPLGNGTAWFSPSEAGIGTHQITYSYITGNNCLADTTVDVTVNGTTFVNILGLADSYCLNDPQVTILGNQQPAGNFTGPIGLVDNNNGTASFDPAVAGVGVHQITYQFTNGSGCISDTTRTVTVHALPVVYFSGLQSQYCVDAQPVTLTGNQQPNGLFTGPGINNIGLGRAQFNPAIATAGGPYDITYEYTNLITGCTNSETQQVVVHPLPTASFTGLDPEYCANSEQDTLIGDMAPLGEFAGPGIVDNGNGTAYFRPWLAGPGGPYTISYTYTDGNMCTAIAEMTTLVRTVEPVNFTGLNPYYCAEEGIIANLIGGKLPFGEFTIDPVTVALVDLANGTATFDPFIAGPGTYQVTYSFTDNNGCISTKTRTVTVNPLPEVSISNLDPEYCVNDLFTIIEGNHQPDGQFTFAGGPAAALVDLGNGKAKFIPSVAGVGGPYDITYTYIDGNACQNDTTVQTIVVPKPQLLIANLASDYCLADGADTIVGNKAPLGHFSGPGITDLNIGKAIFDPAVAGSGGPYSIVYTFDDPSSCSNDTTYLVNVHPTPVVLFTGLLPEFCEDDTPVLLIGNQMPDGTFTGPGVLDYGLGYALFTPADAGVGGPYNIRYLFSDPNGCADSMILTTVVNPLPEKPASLTVNHNDYCLNSVNALTFTATGGSGTTLKWFRGACGSNLVGTGTEITVAAPNDTTWYYARWENGCGESECDSIRINVLFVPVAPATLAVDQNDFCAGTVTDISLSAEGGFGAELKWYSGSCGGVYLGTGNPFVTPAPAVSTTYFAKWTNICGESACKSIVVNVVPQPVIADSVSVNKNSFCSGSQSSIILKYHGGSGDVFEWFRGVCSDTLIGTGQNLEVIAPTITTSYFGRWKNACDSTPCQQVTVTVWPLPVAPDSVSTTENEFCAGTVTTLTLTAHGGSGDEVVWYENDCGAGTSIGSGPTLLINAPTASMTYYARWESNCGASLCAMKEITVFPQPLPIDSMTVDTNNFCRSYNGIIILNAFGGAGDTLNWYQDGCGTAIIGTGSELRVQAPDTNTWFFAKWVSECGTSNCDSIEVKVNIPLPVDTTFVDKPVVCFNDAGLVTLTAQGGRGDVLNWFDGTCGGTPIGTGNTLQLPSPTVTTTYIARWENSCEVTECDSVTVQVIPEAIAPTLVTADTNNFCQGAVPTVTLTAVGGYGDTITGQGETLRWFFANCEGIEAGTGNPLTIPAPLFNTSYFVRWENTCSASECASIEILVNNPEPVVLVEVDTNDFCPGTVTDITLFAHGGHGDQLKWFTNENGTYTNIGTGYPLNIFAPDTTTWYYVRWENVCGVSAYDSIRVNVNKPVVPPVLTVDTNNFCSDYGFQIALGGLGGNGDTLRWFEGACNGPELGTGNPLWINHPLVTTTYFARYENECGITECNSIVVTVVPHPELLAGTLDSVCERSDYQVVDATASNYTTVLWTTDGTGTFVDPSVLNPVYQQGTDDLVTRDTVNLIMTVTGNSPCGAYVDTLVLIINPLPVISVNDTNPLICRDSVFTFIADGAFSYNWSPEAGLSSPTGNTVEASPQTSTSYLITGTSEVGCVDSLRVYVTVRTTPYVNLGPDRYLYTCEPVLLDAGASDGVDNYEWQDGSPRRYFNVEENGTYWVTVSNDACAVTDTIRVQLCGGFIYMPSAFSPNSDGLNEVLKARSSDETIKFHMYVFSRNGALVYETDDLYEGWDGTDTKGNDCPSGVYIWKIVYRGNGTVSPGIEQTQTGSVMLIR